MMIKVPEGTVIIREGEANMDMYKIVSGNAEIYTGYETENEAILGIKSKDEYFGEMGLLTGGKPSIYTVVAYSDMLLMRITEADIDEFILKNHSDVYRIMQHMAESMYGLKYGMDMYVKDLEDSKNNAYLKGFSGYFSKQFAKYNATNMKDPMKEAKGKINYKV
ncbi:Crp/Fnr family transcriptional regulator [Butyrivibrio sp. FCS014]|uniref:Crp/Fnr family transcriptional regulator n=1 Tax=Butyrivibrio sp. FCS014 TaxID=1408304 RepID=UPI000466EE9F|nr:cyclic nucleotide-binding domain-containing protein [Butyrivibrio sp. FCS014]